MPFIHHGRNPKLDKFLDQCGKLRSERYNYLKSTISKVLNTNSITYRLDNNLPFIFSDNQEFQLDGESAYIYGKFDLYAYCLKETLNIKAVDYKIDMDSLNSTIELSVKLLNSNYPEFELLNKSVYGNSPKALRYLREKIVPLPDQILGCFVYSLLLGILFIFLSAVIASPTAPIENKPLFITLLSILIIAVLYKAVAPALVKIFFSNKTSVKINIDNPVFNKDYELLSKDDSIDNEFKLKYVFDDDIINRIQKSKYQISKIMCHNDFLNIAITSDLLDDKNCLDILEELIDIVKCFDEIEN